MEPVSRGQYPVADGVPDESISRTPQTEPSGILIDPHRPPTIPESQRSLACQRFTRRCSCSGYLAP